MSGVHWSLDRRPRFSRVVQRDKREDPPPVEVTYRRGIRVAQPVLIAEAETKRIGFDLGQVAAAFRAARRSSG